MLVSDVRLDYGGSAFSWSPDSLEISFRRSGPEEKTFDIYTVDVKGSAPVNRSGLADPRSPPIYESSIPLWDHHGSAFYFIREGALWRAPASGDKASKIAEVPGRKIHDLISRSENLLWMSGEDKSTVVVTKDEEAKQDGLYRIDLISGRSERLRENGECYSCANVDEPVTASRSGKELVFFKEDVGHSRDLWLTNDNFETERRVTHLNPQFDKYALGAGQLIRWLSDDGALLQGALLLPAGHEEGKRYPLVVWVYGGEFLSSFYSRFGFGFEGPFNWQLLATRGYAVLLPDAPLHVGTPVLDLAKTVLPGVNRVIEMGIADPGRLGVIGHSYGGYSTLALLTQTTRFKGAIEVDGFSDLGTVYGEMNKDGSAYFTPLGESKGPRGMGGTPWEFRERYIENSPYFFLDQLETPLLIVHGSNDLAVAPFLGDQLFVALRRLGREVEYAKYEGEDHSPDHWSNANQVDFVDRMISWFDHHLKQ